MWIARGWKDYELIDCGEGKRLERWGKYTLVRPDPAAIWKISDDKGWHSPDAIYKRSNTGGGSWDIRSLPQVWKLTYGALTFHVRAMGFKHTGIFPEQAANWDWFSALIAAEAKKREKAGSKKPIQVLNLFAYTGGASVAATAAGASVCHVDAAKGMVAYAKENAELSNTDSIRYIVDDCFKFVAKEIRRGKRYDAVIMDPPSYGRGPSGEVWKLEEGLYDLVELVSNVLSEEPLFMLLNAYTTGISPKTAGYIMESLIQKRYGGKVESEELGLMVTKTGLSLPCGSSSRWMKS